MTSRKAYPKEKYFETSFFWKGVTFGIDFPETKKKREIQCAEIYMAWRVREGLIRKSLSLTEPQICQLISNNSKLTANAGGRPPRTSPNPPVLHHGATSVPIIMKVMPHVIMPLGLAFLP